MSGTVFITGGTGYLGTALITRLLEHGHTVRALARPDSAYKLPAGCITQLGDALDADSYAAYVAPATSFVHLVGVSHLNPAKAAQFTRVDLASVRAALAAASRADIRHFVYVSVAQPAPLMHAFVQARAQAEDLIRASHIPATLLRPWYVLGPGHRWPYALLPVYGLLERLPATRDSARRLGLVTLEQMTHALAHAVEHPARDITVLEVPQIRSGQVES